MIITIKQGRKQPKIKERRKICKFQTQNPLTKLYEEEVMYL